MIRFGRGASDGVSGLVRIAAGPLEFTARLETERAPRTVEWFLDALPLRGSILQARWSGFAAWVPLGEGIELPAENATAVPSPGQLLLYPGGLSEPEILFPYGACTFTSVAGPLVGNHFLTVIVGDEQFDELGRLVQWEGAQDVTFELVESQ